MLATLLTIALQGQIFPCPLYTPPPPSYGEHTICVPATGQSETYDIQGPVPIPSIPVPLVILFHSFGKSHTEIQATTLAPFLSAAIAQGWLVVMHDTGNSNYGNFNNYGADVIHKHTKAVVQNLVARGFAIDFTRVYGYGFSMGGANVVSYAARHLDPTQTDGMFAAILTNSGTVAPLWYYFNQPSTQPGLNAHYGLTGTDNYCTKPYNFYRGTVIALDSTPCGCGGPACSTPPILDDDCTAHNMAKLPIWSTHTTGEGPQFTDQNALLDTFMNAQTGNQHTLTIIDCGSSSCPSFPYCSSGHSWDTVCAEDAIAFFAAHTRTVPTSGKLRIVEDKRLFHLSFDRTDDEQLGKVDWSITVSTNRVDLDFIRNLTKITVFAPDAGLDTQTVGSILTVDLTVTQAPVTIAVQGYGSSTVIDVKRRGQSAPYSIVNGAVVFTEQATGGWKWTIHL